MPEPTSPPRPRSRSAVAAPRPAVRPAGIHSVASAVPERVVSSSELEERMGLSAGWIQSRTGVRERRVAAADETLADLAAAAADRALAAAAVSPREVDLVLVATLTADQRMPNAAPVVAEMIGARGAGAIDVGAACTCFVSALATAAAAVESDALVSAPGGRSRGAQPGHRLRRTADRRELFGYVPGPSWSGPLKATTRSARPRSVPTDPQPS